MLHAPSRSGLPNTNISDFDALRQRNDALQQALICAEAHAQVTAHDLRTPLNTLSGLLHLMTLKFAADLPEAAREYLDYMARAVAQMDDLTGAFLEQVRAAGGTLAPEQVDMRHAVDAVIRDLHAETHQTDVLWDVRGETWCQMADPALLRLMLVNLLRNAVQFRHPARSPIVVITLTHTANGAGCLRINDNGAGFESTQAKAIFLPQNSAVEGSKGGLGLAVCHAICKRHNWGISAQSNGVTGATFEVEFTKP